MDETFERELLSHLSEQYRLRPAIQPEDAVKFVFQGLLGVGHLLCSREAVTAYITREMESVEPDPAESLCETLSPGWCRLNLRRAKAERLEPDAIAGLMMTSRPAGNFTRNDVLDVCRKLSFPGGETPDGAELACVLDGNWLPSHSEAYREAYRPAYRVISADWLPYLNAVIRISSAPQSRERLTVTLDGPCASGKTTLAGRLAEVFGASVIHTDDFVIPHSMKTPERLAIPGGNCDAERLEREILGPWTQGGTVRYRKYDCASDRLLPEEILPDSRVLIIEGCYCNLPQIRKYADVRLFLDAPWEKRDWRLKMRETEASLKMFYEKWIPLENAYFEAFGLPDGGMEVISEQ